MKVLLMGKSASGKTSMRTVIFSNNLPAQTARLGATIDVEQNHVRFLGSLVLNLWDCGGQVAFYDSYLSTQRNVMFHHVGVLIYVFDVGSKEFDNDVGYWRDCIEACNRYSPDAKIFVLVHKMDLMGEMKEKKEKYRKFKRDLEYHCGGIRFRTFATSIWDESLYKAWSSIIHTLIPNGSLISQHLATFNSICSATEVVLFEKTTFLVIAWSGDPEDSDEVPDDSHQFDGPVESPGPDGMHPQRFEKISELIKAFKLSCAGLREQFQSLEIRFPTYTALLEVLTGNTYVMIIVADPDVQSAALKLNVKLARERFEQLQVGSL